MQVITKVKKIIYEGCDICNMDRSYLSISFIVLIFLPCLCCMYLIMAPLYLLGFLISKIFCGIDCNSRNKHER